MDARFYIIKEFEWTINDLIELPDEPENFTSIGGDHMIVLNWSAPFQNGGFPIIRYNIYRSLSENDADSYELIASVTGTN